VPEQLYTEYPELYDVLQSDWDYDRDISFVCDAFGEHGVTPDDACLLEIGCGTGEHTRRFVAVGYDVTAVDKYEGMLAAAREKCDADFRRATLPDLPLDGEYDAVVAARGVINHLPPDDLSPALERLAALLGDGGVLVFDNSSLPPEGNRPGMDTGTTERGTYAYVAQHVPDGDGRLDWRSVLFAPDGEVVVSSRKMTPFDDATIEAALDRLEFDSETHEGYGPEDDRTVFVAVA
jgi:SAM-dependent methyltransferase